jgi:hypothetical protein
MQYRETFIDTILPGKVYFDTKINAASATIEFGGKE